MDLKEFDYLSSAVDHLKLVPIGINTPQDQLAKELATILAIEGIEDLLCLPLAIEIMAAFQKGINSGKIEDIIEYLKKKGKK